MKKQLFLFLAFFSLAITACNKDSETAVKEIEPAAQSADEPKTFEKKVLVELFSNTTCGACPLAHHEIERLEDSISTLVHISHKLSGPMAHEYGFYTIDQNKRTLYTPLAHVQRLGDDVLGPIYFGTGRFEEMIQGQLFAKTTNIGLAIESDINGSIADINVRVESLETFKETALELTVLLVEKEVIGSGSGYDQRNYGHTDPDHPYFGKGEWMEGFVHRNIVRNVLTDQAGDLIESTLPWDLTKSFTIDFSTINSAPKDFMIIAFVSPSAPGFSEMLNVEFASLD